MTTKELLELDAWIAFHVMHKTESLIVLTEANCWIVPRYSSDPAAAMEVLKKCAGNQRQSIDISNTNTGWSAGIQFSKTEFIIEHAETPELAICLFAKKLFTK